MKTEPLDAKSLDIRELAGAPIWLKLLLFITIAGGAAMCLAGFIILSGPIEGAIRPDLERPSPP